MAKHLSKPTEGKIESVVITWRRKDGTIRRMQINTAKARGIIWRYDPKRDEKPFDHFEGKTDWFPVLPGTSVEILGKKDPPNIKQPQSDGDAFCYWDEAEGEWFCPPEPEP